MSQSTQKKATILFSGYVQGVGFRYTTLELSQHYHVTGYVRNLTDGSVECVAEGEEAEVGRFLDGIRASPMGRYITGERLTWAHASGRFSRFSIAY